MGRPTQPFSLGPSEGLAALLESGETGQKFRALQAGVGSDSQDSEMAAILLVGEGRLPLLPGVGWGGRGTWAEAAPCKVQPWRCRGFQCLGVDSVPGACAGSR